jgi:Fe-Mn family superoxide dismutase
MQKFTTFYEAREQLQQTPLPCGDSELEPVMSKNTIDYHFHHLAAGYVKRFNKGEGDPIFNKHGAFLHNVFFEQFQSPQQNNRPDGVVKKLIISKFQTFNNFKEEFEKIAMKIQGSGWIYLSKSGKIITFPNHSQMPDDIALLVDWWEHAWALDYQADKGKYLKNIWSIIDWRIINNRCEDK